MTVVATLPERSYTPRTLSPPTFNVPASTREVRFSFSRVGWPAGKVAEAEILGPDGSSFGRVGFDGGNTLARDGTATSAYGLGDRNGSYFLPVGTYTPSVVIFQTITTAVTIERF